MKFIISNLLVISVLATQAAQANPAAISKAKLNKVSSTRALDIEQARVIIDNDEAFRSKLAAIQKAATSIDMIYYIYSNDYSSAVMTQALMAKARQGVKVRLIVDYLTNLKNADLLLTMQQAGIEIKLYNKPTTGIKRDAVYVTSPCLRGATGEACVRQKDKKSADLLAQGNGTDFMSRLFLTGLYAKNGALLKTGVLEGQELDLDKIKNGPGRATEQEQEQLKEFAKLFIQAKLKGGLVAKFKLWLAFQMYGEQLAPIYNLVTETLPITSDGMRAKDWMYLSDYTHHKLLIVDGKYLQLGGRNIEDSYHMKFNDLDKSEDKKYIFMDTDFYAEVGSASGQELGATFDRMWNLNWMVSSLRDVDADSELEALARVDLLVQAVKNCKTDSRSSGETNGTCIERQFRALVANDKTTRSVRLALVEGKIHELAAIYNRDHKTTLGESDKISINSGRLSAKDLSTAQIYYIENLPFGRPNWFEKLTRGTAPVRQFGADLQNEYKSNKNIHELLVSGLQNVCQTKDLSASKEIVLHNAYFFPSPNVMRAFGNMMNGTWDCSGVTVTILTNSYETTDLFPVNAVASTQFKAMFDINTEEIRKGNKRTAKFRLLEYKKSAQGDDRSLHSKVSLIGDDMIIGSANMDIRSYAMDTNNGVYIRHAKDLTREYREFIQALVRGDLKDESGQTKFLVHDRTPEMTTPKSKEQFIEEQVAILRFAASQFKTGRRLIGDEAKPETRERYLGMLRSMMNFVYGVTVGGLDHDRIRPSNGTSGVTPQELERYQKNEQRRFEKMIQDLLSTI